MKVGLFFLSILLAASVAAECYGKAARSFAIRAVDDAVRDSQQGPPDDDLVPSAEFNKDSGKALWLKRDGQLGSDALSDAYACINLRSGAPSVEVTLTPAGARAFAELTTQNVLRRLAIVVDDEVVLAPTIVKPILNGELQIGGTLTVAQAESLAAQMLGVELPASRPEPRNCPGAAPNYQRVG